MKAFLACLPLLAFSSGLAQMGIPPAVVEQAKASYLPQASSFTIKDTKYTFRQATLEQNFEGLLPLLEERVKKGKQDIKTPGSAVAYCVIAAGEFAQPTPKLTDLLEKVRVTVGKLPVPDGITWPERSYLGAASMAFVNEKGDGFDSAGLLQKDNVTFEDLVWAARLKIAIRDTKTP